VFWYHNFSAYLLSIRYYTLPKFSQHYLPRLENKVEHKHKLSNVKCSPAPTNSNLSFWLISTDYSWDKLPFITKQSHNQEEGNWCLPWLVSDTNLAVAQYPLCTGSIRNHQMDSVLFILILPKYKSLWIKSVCSLQMEGISTQKFEKSVDQVLQIKMDTRCTSHPAPPSSCYQLHFLSCQNSAMAGLLLR
jgi:hypothetical protein